MTNADKIRAMSDEELAGLISKGGCRPDYEFVCKKYLDCEKCWLDWLKQEAEEEKHGL